MVIRGYNECHNILTITFLFNLTTSYWYTTYHKYSDNAYNATKHTTRTYSFLNFEIVYLGNKLVSQMNYCYNKSKCWLAVIGLNQVILWFKIFSCDYFPIISSYGWMLKKDYMRMQELQTRASSLTLGRWHLQSIYE